MKRVQGGFRDFIEKFYPANPLSFSFTLSSIFGLALIGFLIGGVFYLRSENKNELELLQVEHQKIQTAIINYLRDMSEVKYNSDGQKELNKIVDEYRKKLEIVDEDIKRIKAVWFLD